MRPQPRATLTWASFFQTVAIRFSAASQMNEGFECFALGDLGNVMSDRIPLLDHFGQDLNTVSRVHVPPAIPLFGSLFLVFRLLLPGPLNVLGHRNLTRTSLKSNRAPAYA